MYFSTGNWKSRNKIECAKVNTQQGSGFKCLFYTNSLFYTNFPCHNAQAGKTSTAKRKDAWTAIQIHPPPPWDELQTLHLRPLYPLLELNLQSLRVAQAE